MYLAPFALDWPSGVSAFNAVQNIHALRGGHTATILSREEANTVTCLKAFYVCTSPNNSAYALMTKCHWLGRAWELSIHHHNLRVTQRRRTNLHENFIGQIVWNWNLLYLHFFGSLPQKIH